MVSYAGDVRGIVEDALGKTRTVRASVPAFGYVPDLVDGSELVAGIVEGLEDRPVKSRSRPKA